MPEHLPAIAAAVIKTFDDLSELEKRIVKNLIERKHVSRDINKEYHEHLSFGDRVADRVAAIGGSWTFILTFVGCLVGWIILNSIVLAHRNEAFDPYPYILLNLVLSMLASLQAPIIMMSQNRHAEKDRINAAHDYEVNLKAEYEITELHRKIDELRTQQWEELLQIQREQIDALKRILETHPSAVKE